MNQGETRFDSSASKLIADAAVCWAMAHGRQTPWRVTANTYRLAVAEILLQKTKGQDAEPVWRAVISAYPTAESLASATDQDLHRIVSQLGLGTQRVDRLRKMAAALVTKGTNTKLPGLGPYGSAVVALTAGFDSPVPPVDGNIARVICRVFGLTFQRGEPRKKPEVKQAVACLLGSRKHPRDKLQVAYALVDLGATICTPLRPSCTNCPVVRWCLFGSGRTAET